MPNQPAVPLCCMQHPWEICLGHPCHSAMADSVLILPIEPAIHTTDAAAHKGRQDIHPLYCLAGMPLLDCMPLLCRTRADLAESGLGVQVERTYTGPQTGNEDIVEHMKSCNPRGPLVIQVAKLFPKSDVSSFGGPLRRLPYRLHPLWHAWGSVREHIHAILCSLAGLCNSSLPCAGAFRHVLSNTVEILNRKF